MELRIADPLVDLRTTARREVLLTNLASIMVGVAFYAISLVLPQLLQLPKSTGYGLGQSMVVAGLCVAPLGLTMMFVAPLYARISARRGPKVTLMLGMLVIAVGYGAGIGLMSAPWQTVVIAVVVGAGIGLAYSSLPALIIGAVDPSETGAANGLNTLMRSIGTSVSSAVIGMVLAHMSQQRRDGHGAHDGRLPGLLPDRDGRGHRRRRPGVLPAVAAQGVPSDPGRAEHGQRCRGGARRRRRRRRGGGPIGRPAGPAREVRTVLGPAGHRNARPAVYRPRPPRRPRPDRPRRRPASAGRVLDASGTPVPGASITLIDRQGRQADVTTADADGRYALAAPAAGTYVLTGAAPGHTPYAASAMYRGEGVASQVDLILAGTGRLGGVLRGGREGAPLAGGSIVLTDAGGEVVTRTTSGTDGRWETAPLPPGPYTLVLSAPGHQPQARAIELSGGEPERQDVCLEPTATVRGTVRGPNGRPLADAAVTLVEDGTVAAHTVTGPDGAFAFSDLSGPHYTLTAAGYPPHAVPISLAGGAHEILDLDLAQPSAATG